MVLLSILHQYGRFSIVTIDSFFHSVIRSFAREMGLQGTFSIDLDIDKIIQEVIDLLLDDLGKEEMKDVRMWLTQFAESKVEEGKSWDFRSDITSLAKQTLSDSYKPHAANVLALQKRAGFFKEFLKELKGLTSSFEKHCEQLCQDGIQKMNSVGGVEVFSRKAMGPAGLFNKVLAGDYIVSEGRRNAQNEITKWLTKDGQKQANLVTALENDIFPIYNSIIAYIDNNMIEYQSSAEVYRYFYTFGILSAINEKVGQYREENDAMLIADLPDFLRQVINESDTPFIYEKVGAVFHHYLIDEFQDTSAFQWTNFKPLVKNSADEGYRNLVVGDVKQSIYRWRGGNWNLLNGQVEQDIGSHHTEVNNLNTNWRSTKRIIDFNNWLFGGFKDLSLQYFDDANEGTLECLDQVFDAYSDAAQEVANKEAAGLVEMTFLEGEYGWQQEAINKTIAVVENAQAKGYRLSDMAILTRSQREGKMIADAFMAYKTTEEAKEGLRYEVVSSEALFLYSSHSVKFLVSLISWLNHEENTIVLSEWLYEWKCFVAEEGVSENEIFGAIQQWAEIAPKEFVKQKDYLKTLPLFELVESLIRIFKLNEISNEFTYLQGFQDAVLDYSKNERGDIPSFLEWWENVRKDRAIQVADENDAVKILTIHKAKGLEFPIVIVPFLHWKLDHDAYGREEILWVQPPEHETLKQLPVIPLRYSSKLMNSYWSEDYWKEKVDAFMDSINLLYVTCTRPVEALYAFGEKPKNKKIANIGTFCHELLQDQEGWNEEQGEYSVGELRTNTKVKKPSNEYAIQKYESQPWRGKVSVQMKGAIELSEMELSSQLSGISLHNELASVVDLTEIDGLRDEVKGLLSREEVKFFFENLEDVKVEVPILMPGGNFYRIDRMVKKDGCWIVIDFKTGAQRDKDQQQVKNYLKILQQMGYENPKGFLIYTDPVLVKEVA